MVLYAHNNELPNPGNTMDLKELLGKLDVLYCIDVGHFWWRKIGCVFILFVQNASNGQIGKSKVISMQSAL